ncbi:MAG: sugar phosphate isomerase/epimerase [Planctomycetes bacterium]|nr:sugar phosphate isomerase/epimerase [Planctomycetota bacterium]
MSQLSSRREVLQFGAAFAAGQLIGGVTPVGAIEPIKRNGTSKMKLSCAAYSFREQLTGKKEPNWTLDDFIDFCARNGLEGTELTSYYFPKEITSEYLAHLKHKTFLLGLDISGTPVSNNFCLPAGAERDKHVAHVKQWVDYAAALASPCMRIFSGSTPKGHTEAEARAWCVECIEECCTYAGQKGVFLALENHGGLSATAEGLLAIVRRVRSPWFGVNLDTGNFNSSDPYAELAQVAPYAVTVQVKTEVKPAGSAKHPADLAKFVGILRDANYRGYVALEYEAAEDPNVAVPRHLAELRKLIG